MSLDIITMKPKTASEIFNKPLDYDYILSQNTGINGGSTRVVDLAKVEEKKKFTKKDKIGLGIGIGLILIITTVIIIKNRK